MRNSNNLKLSRPTKEALHVLALLIDNGRKEKRWTQNDLAERLGVSRFTVQHLLKGDPSVAIGTFFEAAVLTGVPLLQAEAPSVASMTYGIAEKAALLPYRVRKPKVVVDDNF